MHRPALLLLSAITGLLLSTTCTQAADWNQWRGAARDGVAAGGPRLIESLPATGLKPLWISQDEIPAARDSGWSSPIVADGKVYLFAHKKTLLDDAELPPKKFPYLPPEKRTGMSDKEYEEYEANRREEDLQRSKSYRFEESVYALSAATGKALWSNQRPSVYARFPQSSSPTVIDGKLYVLGAGRTARCVDAASGKDLWQTRLPGDFLDEYQQSSFVIADGVAVVLCGRLFGLDAATGAIVWQGSEDDESGLHTSPVVWTAGDRQRIIVNVAGGQTICVEPKTGRELWRVESEGGHSTPVIAGDRLLTYGSSRKKGLRCFSLSEGEPELLWTYQGAADPGSSPVVLDGHAYVQGENRMACVDLETGKAAWMTNLDIAQPRYTSLIAADGKIIYAFDGLLCFTAKPDEFQPLMNAKIDDTGLLADETAFRKMLNIDKLETTSEGQKEADQLWRKKFGNGPLPCSSPAIVDGKIYLRLKNGVACYDLSAAAAAESE
jgi:outer membrane protein assembly factor BamB